MERIILKVENLSVELDGVRVIKNLSFKVREGEIVTILGPNGAGKTTLLKALLGIVPYKGKIWWKKGIKKGYVPQRVPFIRDFPLTVKEFFGLKESSEEKIKEVAKAVGLERFLDRKIGNLSSGEFQRTLIAWALLKDPEVLLFDEPVAGIDLKGEETIYSLLMKLKRKKRITILLVTHDLSVVFRFSNYVICLNKQPVCQGKPRKVLTPEALEKLYGTEIKFYSHKD